MKFVAIFVFCLIAIALVSAAEEGGQSNTGMMGGMISTMSKWVQTFGQNLQQVVQKVLQWFERMFSSNSNSSPSTAA